MGENPNVRGQLAQKFDGAEDWIKAEIKEERRNIVLAQRRIDEFMGTIAKSEAKIAKLKDELACIVDCDK